MTCGFQHSPLSMVALRRLLSMVYQDFISILNIPRRLLQFWQISFNVARRILATGIQSQMEASK
ncbi:hypothetical protein DVH24_002630 [Malus domestica]|uniref:Uncharacterized protein n=1 Tax=Malus domestica TaxID=3750 RepID=A0A498KAR8_MALDO|nr:hypothetical protein DVH24_002630 [Malus domestica]